MNVIVDSPSIMICPNCQHNIGIFPVEPMYDGRYVAEFMMLGKVGGQRDYLSRFIRNHPEMKLGPSRYRTGRGGNRLRVFPWSEFKLLMETRFWGARQAEAKVNSAGKPAGSGGGGWRARRQEGFNPTGAQGCGSGPDAGQCPSPGGFSADSHERGDGGPSG